MKRLIDWLDSRTGIKKLTAEALYEKVPGGARWRYVWGSSLTFCLVVQFITGMFLWMGYAPSATSAWASVYYIQHEMSGGWFLRGLHHFTAQMMTVLLVLHLMQVVIDGAYKAPREVNWFFGVGLLGLTLALSLTGYLLPWDQKGYWATKVATNIAAITPVFGDQIQRLIIGGTDYGHHTLTRFFALHAGVLPAAIVLLVVGHIALFRKHGITPRKPLRKPDAAFWPDQVLMDAVACLAVLATVVFLTVKFGGAPLAAPADPSEPYSAARPEWYFLFLFQFLKYFPGGTEVWGAIIIPSLAMLILAVMPFIGKWRLGHTFNGGFLVALLLGAGLLTWQAKREDSNNPSYLVAEQQAQRDAKRVVELAQSPTGIPPEGAVSLLRADPLTQGPRLFAKHCASCHRYDGHDGTGNIRFTDYAAQTGDSVQMVESKFAMTDGELRAHNNLTTAELTSGQMLRVKEPATAPDLKGFGSRAWLAGMLDPAQVGGDRYFGGTKFKDGKMAKWVRDKLSKKLPAKQAELNELIAAVSAEAGLKSQRALEAGEQAVILKGRGHVGDEFGCTDCHQFRKPDEDATAPDLTGWGSREWLVGVIANPTHERFYGKKNDRMPKFKDDGILNDQAIGLLADWLRGEWYVPGETAATK
jgi:quinol-cytochrome oxidoreductase complex cytochrome b subunit/mono/diheme cytochrome c family protein